MLWQSRIAAIEYGGEMKRETSWPEIIERYNVRWKYSGSPSPEKRHAKLTTLLCTNELYRGKNITGNPKLVQLAAEDLMSLLSLDVDLKTIDMVVGPDENLTKAIALQVFRVGGRNCGYAVPNKTGDAESKNFSFPVTPNIFKGKRILLCDDVLSTGSSLAILTQMLEHAGAVVLPCLAVIVNRSGLEKETIYRKKIYSLFAKEAQAWMKGKCPYCAAGSEAIRANTEEGWARLNGKLEP